MRVILNTRIIVILATLIFFASAYAETLLRVEYNGETIVAPLSFQETISDEGDSTLDLFIYGDTQTLWENDDFQGIFWFWKFTVVKARFSKNQLILKLLARKGIGTDWHEDITLNMIEGELYFDDQEKLETIDVSAWKSWKGIEVSAPVFNQN